MADSDNTDSGGVSGTGRAGGAAPDPGQKVKKMNFVIAIPDLRNGSLVNIMQAAPKAAMSALYHWPIITGLPAAKAIDTVEWVIRACYAQQIHALGGTPGAQVAAELRKRAIVLGGIRCGAAAAYKLAAADLTRSELSPSGMVFYPDSGNIGADTEGQTSAARWTAAQSMDDLTDLEESVVGLCVYMGMSVPVLQGISLVSSGHHYIPPTYNLFAGQKRQALGSATAEVRTWVETMGDEFNDMAFHKAMHPMDPTLKRTLSKSNEVAQRLRASGHGSAAIRLPAIPSEASGGKAALALLKSASGTFREMGHTLTYEEGLSLMMKLENAQEGVEEAAACDAIVEWISRNSQSLAFCAGIVQQVHETAGTGKNTILAAYSIKRLMAENPSQTSRGQTYARAANAIMRRAMEEGTFSDPTITL